MSAPRKFRFGVVCTFKCSPAERAVYEAAARELFRSWKRERPLGLFIRQTLRRAAVEILGEPEVLRLEEDTWNRWAKAPAIPGPGNTSSRDLPDAERSAASAARRVSTKRGGGR